MNRIPPSGFHMKSGKASRRDFFISLYTPNSIRRESEIRNLPFHLSLRKILPLLAGSIAFVGAGAWMILHAQSDPSWAARYVIPAIGWLSILFFGTCGVGLFILLVLRRRCPLVIVSPEGLRVNTIFRPTKGYFFPWKSIEGFRRERIAGNELLAIHVRDLAQRYDSSGMLEKANIALTLRICDTPYTINDRLLDAEPGQLEHVLEEYLAARGEARQQ